MGVRLVCPNLSLFLYLMLPVHDETHLANLQDCSRITLNMSLHSRALTVV